jgi:hypothetical protein
VDGAAPLHRMQALVNLGPALGACAAQLYAFCSCTGVNALQGAPPGGLQRLLAFIRVLHGTRLQADDTGRGRGCLAGAGDLGASATCFTRASSPVPETELACRGAAVQQRRVPRAA